jgi:putative addiction module component (TIGR02574 family)
MTTAERKYEIIRRITAVTDEVVLKRIEEWVKNNVPASENSGFDLTDAGEKELMRRLKQYEENPENAKSWNLVMEEVRAKYGL